MKLNGYKYQNPFYCQKAKLSLAVCIYMYHLKTLSTQSVEAFGEIENELLFLLITNKCYVALGNFNAKMGI